MKDIETLIRQFLFVSSSWIQEGTHTTFASLSALLRVAVSAVIRPFIVFRWTSSSFLPLNDEEGEETKRRCSHRVQSHQRYNGLG